MENKEIENCADTIINKCYELKLMIAVKTGSYSNRTICPDSLMVVPVGNMEFEKRKFGQADESTFVNLHQHL
ncbi:hypothetical protein T4B_14107 [Trichinella pseudospiralis]|uniref:Uncharacterized protein n=1 Tax=Trichinella pseudospiralis TaxID=6337 RepID=A0A0V1IUQ2_TRIPS|nr:hypothetical protein T4B_14107 [Trichinella pseudospiralis]